MSFNFRVSNASGIFWRAQSAHFSLVQLDFGHSLKDGRKKTIDYALSQDESRNDTLKSSKKNGEGMGRKEVGIRGRWVRGPGLVSGDHETSDDNWIFRSRNNDT